MKSSQIDEGPTACNACPPVVGVLCVDVAKKLQQHYGASIRSYIAASYIKYLEAQGAHVVPIWIGRERNYYEHIMTKVNGVLLPGGAVFIDSKQSTVTTPNECVQSAAWIIEIALNMNAHQQRHMPIWGTCLGFQLLVLLHTAIVQGTKPEQVNDFRTKCTEMRCALSWQLDERCRESKLLQRLSDEQMRQYASAPTALHYHQYCITPQRFKAHDCHLHWRVLATQKDENGMPFITMVEHLQYPFYGVQFHPERAAYEMCSGCDVHSRVGIEAAQYLARHFIDECRKSTQAVMSAEERLRYSIYNFDVSYTARQTQGRWQQCYLFAANVDYPN